MTVVIINMAVNHESSLYGSHQSLFGQSQSEPCVTVTFHLQLQYHIVYSNVAKRIDLKSFYKLLLLDTGDPCLHIKNVFCCCTVLTESCLTLCDPM